MDNFRDYITVLLSEQNKTKTDLAKFLEMTPQSLNSILIGKHPRRLTLKKVSDFLDIPLDILEKNLELINSGKEISLNNINTPEESVRRIEIENNKIELPYVPAACRATFTETFTNRNIMETFSILAVPANAMTETLYLK